MTGTAGRSRGMRQGLLAAHPRHGPGPGGWRGSPRRAPGRVPPPPRRRRPRAPRSPRARTVSPATVRTCSSSSTTRTAPFAPPVPGFDSSGIAAARRPARRRQEKAARGTASRARRAPHLDGSAVPADDPERRREAEPAPRELGGEERIEDPLQRGFVHATAGVLDLEIHVLALGQLVVELRLSQVGAVEHLTPVLHRMRPSASPRASEALVMRFMILSASASRRRRLAAGPWRARRSARPASRRHLEQVPHLPDDEFDRRVPTRSSLARSRRASGR